jgi:hypothetical protein
MASSTFSFEQQTASRSYYRPIVITAVMLSILLVSLEAVTRLAFARLSHIEARIATDYRAALTTRPGGQARPTILLLGNSLLLEGLDYPGIRRAMAPANPVRFVVESTSYLDWYYGIRRLLSSGARPDRIVLCLNLSQLFMSRLRGDYSAYYLIRTPDLARAGREAGIDLTGISSLFFARYSLFYAGRNNLRSFVLHTVDAPYADAIHALTVVSGGDFTDHDALGAATRLDQLRALCAQYKVEFSFLLPPGFGHGSQGLMEAGRKANTPVLIPVAQNSWDSSRYTDNLHLNPAGAVEFTKLLAVELAKPR